MSTSSDSSEVDEQSNSGQTSESRWRRRGWELAIASVALFGVLASGWLSYQAGSNQSEASAASQTQQFFIQERRQAYSDFYASVLALIAFDKSSSTNSGSVGQGSIPEEDLLNTLDKITPLLDNLTNKLATVKLIGTEEIGKIADDIVDVRTFIGISRVLSNISSEVPAPSDYNLQLETYDESLLETTDGDAQLYENFLDQARQDLGTDEN